MQSSEGGSRHQSRQGSRDDNMPAEVPVVHTVHVDKSPPKYSAGFTVRARAQPTSVGEGLELNARYFATIPGIIKIVEVIICLVCMICISPPVTWFARLFTFVIAYSFAITVIIMFCVLVSMSRVVFPNVHWTFIELCYTIVTSFAYFITAVVHLALTNQDPVSDYDPSRPLSSYPVSYKFSIEYYGFYGGYIAAGAFGILNAFVYGTGAYFLFKEWRDVRHNGVVTPAS